MIILAIQFKTWIVWLGIENLDWKILLQIQIPNLSFDREIQKMVISESSGSENLLISRSKSENQIGSIRDNPYYEQYHALIKPTQSLLPSKNKFFSFEKEKLLDCSFWKISC